MHLTVDLQDRNGTTLATIADNEWISGNPLPWDIEFRYRWLCLRSKSHQISLTIDATKEPVTVTGRFWMRGQQFWAKDSEIRFNQHAIDIGFANLGFAFLMLDASSAAGTVAVSPDPAHPEGKFFNWPENCTDKMQYGLDFCIDLRGKQA